MFVFDTAAIHDSAVVNDAAAIYQEAYVYGFPMVDSYRIQHSYFIDTKNPEYKGEWNVPHNVARVYTPEDKAIQTPNSDTPYTFLGADLRAEPIVLSVPAVDPKRYYSLQFVDMYTHNFAYVGSRETGSEAGNYLLAGPDWKGVVPKNIKQVITSETQFAFVLYRTQLYDEKDLGQVVEVQSGYKVQPLSQFVGKAPPPAAPKVDFIAPLTSEAQKSSPQFFQILNFLLQYAPTHPSETALRARFAQHGIGPGLDFAKATASPQAQQAVAKGMAGAWESFAAFKRDEVDTGKRGSGDGFGTRQFLNNDYMARMASAALGIYGNTKEEANYPAYFVDSEGQPMTGANRYTVTFKNGEFPPVNAFWSLTMYQMPESLLVDNPLNRYLINSSMESQLKRDANGDVTLYVQSASPGKDREANWLPAPEGPFIMILREYWPKAEALDGSWKTPPAVRVKN